MTKIEKRDELTLALVEEPVADLSPGPAEVGWVTVEKSTVRLALAKVEWVFDRVVSPSVLPLPVADAFELGCVAKAEVPPSPATAAKGGAGPHVEYGVHTPDLHEYFLTKGQGMSGILLVKRKEDGGWGAALSKNNIPYVLTSDAVEKGVMPPEGKSGLPSTLEKVVPPEYQYWKFQGPQALATRQALVESGMFPDDLVKVVDGDFRLCQSKLFLVEPQESALVGPGVEKSLNAGAAQPAGVLEVIRDEIIPYSLLEKGVVTPFATSEQSPELVVANAAAEKLTIFSAKSLEATEQVIERIAKGELGDKAWMVEFSDSPESRALFAKVGRPFTLKAVNAKGRLFVASFKPEITKRVQYAKVEPVAAPVVAEAPVVATTTKGEQRDIAKHALRLSVRKDAPEDERYVLGIVLEPETIDAQNDIYSEDEIRSTAYKFMEHYRTIGLMHKGAVNDKIKILESFLAPCDMEIGGQPVKKGTWCLGARVLDDALWKSCKAGELTGWSIGGSATRKPDAEATAAKRESSSTHKREVSKAPAEEPPARTILVIKSPEGANTGELHAAASEAGAHIRELFHPEGGGGKEKKPEGHKPTAHDHKKPKDKPKGKPAAAKPEGSKPSKKPAAKPQKPAGGGGDSAHPHDDHGRFASK